MPLSKGTPPAVSGRGGRSGDKLRVGLRRLGYHSHLLTGHRRWSRIIRRPRIRPRHAAPQLAQHLPCSAATPAPPARPDPGVCLRPRAAKTHKDEGVPFTFPGPPP
eukprot:1820938-Pyramimonas_sp.AAC.1